MARLPKTLANLAQHLSRLPGLGPKSAERVALHILTLPEEEALALVSAVSEMRESLKTCRTCFGLAEAKQTSAKDAQEAPECDVCSDPTRDKSMICVVESPLDMFVIERGGEYRGVYHVLGGALSPAEGVYPSDLRFAELRARCEAGDVSEVIVATNPTLEGDSAALYMSEMLKGVQVSVTRLARGLPGGSALAYADDETLAGALKNRYRISESN
jgi:recombination protein RecR